MFHARRAGFDRPVFGKRTEASRTHGLVAMNQTDRPNVDDVVRRATLAPLNEACAGRSLPSWVRTEFYGEPSHALARQCSPSNDAVRFQAKGSPLRRVPEGANERTLGERVSAGLPFAEFRREAVALQRPDTASPQEHIHGRAGTPNTSREFHALARGGGAFSPTETPPTSEPHGATWKTRAPTPQRRTRANAARHDHDAGRLEGARPHHPVTQQTLQSDSSNDDGDGFPSKIPCVERTNADR